jgi:hypothetical protein
MVSIADPIALYMYEFKTATLSLDIEGTGMNTVPVPDGTFTFTRGNIDKHMGLRLEIQVPAGVVGTGPDNKGRQLTVSDLWDSNFGGPNIGYAAQFADYIQMSVSGVVATELSPAVPQPCPCPGTSAAIAVEGIALLKGGQEPSGYKKFSSRAYNW